MRALKSAQAFSLIELLVVVSIMVTLLSIGVASYNSFNRIATLDGAAKALRANLRLAQNFALNGEKIKAPASCASPLVFQGYYVSINTSGTHSYTIGQWCKHPTTGVDEFTSRTPPSPITLPIGVTFSPAPSTTPLTVLFKAIRGVDVYNSSSCCSSLVSPVPANTTINVCTGTPCSGSNLRTVTINETGAVN